jgi:putative transposase
MTPLSCGAPRCKFTRAIVRAGAPMNHNERGEYDLWQRRFWEHTVRDERDFGRCVDYIHFNPVKHGLVAAPIDWPHTSLHRFVREGILPRDWGGGLGPIDGTFGERQD